MPRMVRGASPVIEDIREKVHRLFIAEKIRGSGVRELKFSIIIDDGPVPPEGYSWDTYFGKCTLEYCQASEAAIKIPESITQECGLTSFDVRTLDLKVRVEYRVN